MIPDTLALEVRTQAVSAAGGQPGTDPAHEGHSERGEGVLGVVVRGASKVSWEERGKLPGRLGQESAKERSGESATVSSRCLAMSPAYPVATPDLRRSG